MMKARKKYLGLDWRIIPVFGLIGSIISIIIVPDLSIKLAVGYVTLGIIAVCFALAQRDVWKEDTTKLALINTQRNGIVNYLHPRFGRTYLRNKREVDIQVEWFNGTVFPIEFQHVQGKIQVAGLFADIISLARRTCQPGGRCNYSITTSDIEVVKLVKETLGKAMLLGSNLEWQVNATIEDDNPASKIAVGNVQGPKETEQVIFVET